MPDKVSKPEPVAKPAWVIPPFKTIIDEGTQEIKRQANALVEHTLDSKNAVDPETLRKWGDDGARYFFKQLKARVSHQVGVAAATRAAPRVAKAAAPAGFHAILARAKATVAMVRTATKWPWKAAGSKSAKAPVAVRNWKVQQRYRSSYVTAAIMRGLLVAVIMTIGAIILLRLMA